MGKMVREDPSSPEAVMLNPSSFFSKFLSSFFFFFGPEMSMSITTSLGEMDALVYFNNNKLYLPNAYHVLGKTIGILLYLSLYDKSLTQKSLSPKTQRGFPKIKLELSGRAKI